MQQNKKGMDRPGKKIRNYLIPVQPFSVLHCLRNRKNKISEKNLKKKSNPVQPFNILFCLTGRNTKVHFQNAEVCFEKKII